MNALKKLFTNQFHGSCWNKIYRTKTIRDNGLRFEPEICYCEDLLFNCQYLNCLPENENIIFNSSATYHYMKYTGSNESLTTQKVSKKTTTRLNAIEQMLNIELVENCKPITLDLKYSYIDNISLYIKQLHTWEGCARRKAQAKKYFTVYLCEAINRGDSIKSVIMNLMRIF